MHRVGEYLSMRLNYVLTYQKIEVYHISSYPANHGIVLRCSWQAQSGELIHSIGLDVCLRPSTDVGT